MITKNSRHTLSIPNNTNNDFNIEKVKRRFYSSYCDIKIKKCGHMCCHSQEKCDNCGLAYKLLTNTLICPKMVDDFIKVFLLDTSRLEPEFNYRKRSQFIDDFGKYSINAFTSNFNLGMPYTEVRCPICFANPLNNIINNYGYSLIIDKLKQTTNKWDEHIITKKKKELGINDNTYNSEIQYANLMKLYNRYGEYNDFQ